MKILKILGNIKTISAGLLSIMVALAAVADTRYITYDVIQVRDIKQIRRAISELQVRMNFTKSETDKLMYETIIKMKENQIKEIKGE